MMRISSSLISRGTALSTVETARRDWTEPTDAIRFAGAITYCDCPLFSGRVAVMRVRVYQRIPVLYNPYIRILFLVTAPHRIRAILPVDWVAGVQKVG